MSQAEDLVAAYRILAEFGVIDAYGHVSVRSERDPNRYCCLVRWRRSW